jgi:acetyl-CoA synthetase
MLSVARLPFEEYVINEKWRHKLVPIDFYHKFHKQTVENLEQFWEGVARELEWFTPWHKALDSSNPPFYKWFVGGRLNLSYLAVDRHAKTWRKNKVAIIWEGEPVDERGRPREVAKLTYSDLYREVNRVAYVLKRLGVRKGDVIAIYLPMIPYIAVFMLAAWRVGALTNVVFSGFSAEALADRVNDSKARLLVTADGFWRRGRVIRLKETADRALEKAPSVERVIVVRRLGIDVPMRPGRDYWLDELLKDVPPDVYVEPEPVESDHPSFILYTSGTTGKPKGIVHDTGGWAVIVHATMKWVFDIRDDDVYWCTADVGWVTGHSYVVLGPLIEGATAVMYEGAPDYPQPDRWWAIIERYGVTVFYTTPTAIRMFMRYGEEWPRRHNLSTLRIIGSVGEPINPEAWRWAYRVLGNENVGLPSTWWMTETGGILVSHAPGLYLAPMKPGTNGPPLPGIEAEVVDHKGEPVPPGVRGYLVITKPWPGMPLGLWGDPERYIKTYWARFPGKFFTGDYAVKDKDGYVWVLGRADDVLKVAGHRLGTYELESALVGHPAVAEAAVVGIPDPIKGEVPVAFVVLKEDFAPTRELAEELRKHVRGTVGPIAEPASVLFVSKLPKTRSGKIMRRLLRAVALNAPLGDVTTLEDEAAVEEARALFGELVREVWKSVAQFARKPATVPPNAALRDILPLIREAKFVVVSHDGERVDGVISERDVVRAIGRGVDLSDPAGLIMVRDVVTVDADTPYHEALKLMAERRLRHIVLTKEGKLAGAVSARDLLGEGVLLVDEYARSSLAGYRVRDVMSKPVVTAPPSASIRDVARVMGERNVGLVVVARDNALAGVVSESDIIKALASGIDAGTPAESIMTRSVITIAPDATLADAAGLMAEHRIRHLVVVEGGIPVGVISLRDIIAFARGLI